MLRLLDCFLEVYRETETKKVSNEEIDIIDNSIEKPANVFTAAF